MGVNGLWSVVQPCARPTNLATLNRKRLAVDASIWIYQFLKAVRDKEGNALRNSHIVGFFRRICKLLWFGIQPVFVFDGGAPALKRATIQLRQRRREGRREDAVKTAGKLLAVQMHRIAEEENERRKRDKENVASGKRPAEEELPDMNTVEYVDEFGMSPKEKQQTRTFRKQDQYHLPDLNGSIASMGKPEDPRIMSVEELEEYAQQFHSGEDINLYDFSKIDFDGDFFKSLPPPDRYNILNAARLRSRLRMGMSKEQLDDMFPDRMAFSRFQIERVKERNHLTQRLMKEVGMTGLDITVGGGGGRIAGEKDREYILVKNEGVEGGWALGVVSKEKDMGEAHKPIDVDAIQIQYPSKDGEEDDEYEDVDFEDVPIEGVNRLPKPSTMSFLSQRQHFYRGRDGEAEAVDDGEEGSLFVGGIIGDDHHPTENYDISSLQADEEDDIQRAIALSLKGQHGARLMEEEMELKKSQDELENLPAPTWTQRPAEEAKPIRGTDSGLMIAHIVNNRASAAVPKRQEKDSNADSDSEDDLQAVLAKSRKARVIQQTKPVVENRKNPFDGPLPFPKLNFGNFLASNKSTVTDTNKSGQPRDDVVIQPFGDLVNEDDNGEDDEAGGFEKPDEDKPKPLPPWMTDNTDIRESVKQQKSYERLYNAEDKAEADEAAWLRKLEMHHEMIEIDSDSGNDSDVEIVDSPKPVQYQISLPVAQSSNEAGGSEMASTGEESSANAAAQLSLDGVSLKDADGVDGADNDVPKNTKSRSKAPEPGLQSAMNENVSNTIDEPLINTRQVSSSPEPEFEDVPPAPAPDFQDHLPVTNEAEKSPLQKQFTTIDVENDPLFDDVEYDEFSDPEDEQLLVQMAAEAEEHARFASELNNKPARQNKEDYENELRQLRNQQKKDRRDADEVTQVMITECQALLRLFGIPYITAPMEAEAQCAELVKLGLVDGIVTDDSDTFLFGGTRVYKNMFNSNKFVECYIASDLEKEMSFSREQLISLAQLLGSDYTEGLIGVGPVTAVEILSEFPGKSGLDDFRSWWLSVQSQARPKEADASSTFRKKFRKSHNTKLFLPTGFPSPAVFDAYLYPEVDDSTEAFQWGVPDVEGLRQFLMATIGWDKERTDEVLVPVIRDMNRRDMEGTQSNITRFFGGGVGAGAKDSFAPRERVQGSKRMAAAVDRLRSKVGGDGEASGGGETNSAGKRKRRARQESIVIDDDCDGDVDGERAAQVRGGGKRSKTS